MNRGKSLIEGKAFSIEVTTTRRGGRVVTIRPLPSLVKSTTLPVSATKKFVPQIPALRFYEFRPQNFSSGISQNMRFITEITTKFVTKQLTYLVASLVKRGAKICDGVSPAIWTIYSPRSVSITLKPRSSRYLFK